MGSKSRIRVTRVVGSSGALWTCEKVKCHREHAGFGLLRDPLLLAPRMRDTNTNLKNRTFLKRTRFVTKKTKHDYHVGAGLSGTNFCWHRLCEILSGILFFSLKKTLKMKETRLPRGFGLLRDPLLFGVGMGSVSAEWKSYMFLEKV